MNGWMIALLVVLAICFALTWITVGFKADNDQYARTCAHLQELMDWKRAQECTKAPEPDPLNAQITLRLANHSEPDGEGDGYFYIPHPQLFPYTSKFAQSLCPKEDKSTERQINLRELLNRLLKDVPVVLVSPVEANWHFKDAPKPEPSVVIQVQGPLYSVDNRESPLDPPAPTPGALDTQAPTPPPFFKAF